MIKEMKNKKLNYTNQKSSNIGVKAFARKLQSGITLIALIITIIVMLILVGVTVNTAINGGLFGMAKQAKEQTEKARDIEQELANGRIKVGDTWYDSLEDYINKNPSEDQNSIMLKASDIAKNPKEYFGKELQGYTCDSNGVNAWKIFYADENNVYIIASDYITYENAPLGKGGTPVNKGQSESGIESEYLLYFNEIRNDYNEGSDSIIDERIKKLNYDYFINHNYSSDTNRNMMAVAYLLDLNAWKSYAGDKADYAIGGPTIELLFNSYNAKYGTNYKAQANSNIGYDISTDGGNSWVCPNAEIKLNMNDSLYIVNRENLRGMWIASPTPGFDSTNGVCDILVTSGYIHCNSCLRTDNGIRPVVCLKNDVQFELKEDGTITLQ